MYQLINNLNDTRIPRLASILNSMNDNVLYAKGEPAINEHSYHVYQETRFTISHNT